MSNLTPLIFLALTYIGILILPFCGLFLIVRTKIVINVADLQERYRCTIASMSVMYIKRMN